MGKLVGNVDGLDVFDQERRTMKSVVIDGVVFQQVTTGNRRIFVIDSGWIVAGDVIAEDDNIITIARVVHVQKWSEIWFSGMVANPDSSKVSLAKMPENLEVQVRSVLFRVVVNAEWGLHD